MAFATESDEIGRVVGSAVFEAENVVNLKGVRELCAAVLARPPLLRGDVFLLGLADGALGGAPGGRRGG